MRKLLISAAAVAAIAMFGTDRLQGEGLARLGSDCGCQPADCCECDPCGGYGGFGHGRHGGHGHGHHHHQVYEGQQAHFNCGCNGSYKFPVPPLYTYHWPGMWSQQLMTDYHSPWRFPAIKPYVDEALPVEMGSEEYVPRAIHQASAELDAGPAGESLSFSSRVLQLTR
jgi:hypothetical protein